MRKSNIFSTKFICFTVAMTLILQMFTIGVFAADNTKWGVKAAAFKSCYVVKEDAVKTFDQTTGGSISGVKAENAGGKFGKAADDTAMHVTMPKVYGDTKDAYKYEINMRQPGSSAGGLKNGSLNIYYNMAIAFDELPGKDEIFFGYSKNKDTAWTSTKLIAANDCFTETGRWYNVGIVVEASTTKAEGTLYVDGVKKATGSVDESALTDINQLAIMFENTNSEAPGNFDIYMDDVYVEYGENLPVVVSDKDFYPADDNQIDYSENKIVIFKSDLTVADFYGKLKAASKNTADFAVRDASGVLYDENSTELLKDKYVVYSGTKYGKSGSEIIPLKTFTAPVVYESKNELVQMYEVFEDGNRNVITDKVSVIADKIEVKFTQNLSAADVTINDKAATDINVENNYLSFGIPDDSKEYEELKVKITVTGETGDKATFECSVIVIPAKLRVEYVSGNVSDGVCTITVKLINPDANAKDGSVALIGALYNADGQCKGAGVTNAAVGAGSAEATVSVDVKDKTEGDYIKILLWDSLDTQKGLHPICLIDDGIITFDNL